MSPTSSSTSTIYDHLMINFQQQPKMIMRNNTNLSNNIYDNSNHIYSSSSKSDCNDLLLLKKTQPLPLHEQQRSKRRYTITHISTPEPVVRCSVSNQAYDKPIIQKSIPTSNNSSLWNETNSNVNSKTNPKYFHTPLSPTIEVKPMDYRPLIVNGRRRFHTLSSTTPMVIIKKKSSSPMHTISSFEQVCVKKYHRYVHIFFIHLIIYKYINSRNHCIARFLSILLLVIQQELLVV